MGEPNPMSGPDGPLVMAELIAELTLLQRELFDTVQSLQGDSAAKDSSGSPSPFLTDLTETLVHLETARQLLDEVD